MKYLKSYKLFENQGNEVPIEIFLKEIGIPNDKHRIVIDWWYKNLAHIKIYHFEFSSPEPILGVILSKNEISINKTSNNPRLPLHKMPIFIKLFSALHESKHCDQHIENRFSNLYFDPVKEGDKYRFLKNYLELEKEANDFAINSLREIGFDLEMNREEINLRRNEEAGHMVYDMMTQDIRRFQPIDMIDLYRKQVL